MRQRKGVEVNRTRTRRLPGFRRGWASQRGHVPRSVRWRDEVDAGRRRLLGPCAVTEVASAEPLPRAPGASALGAAEAPDSELEATVQGAGAPKPARRLAPRHWVTETAPAGPLGVSGASPRGVAGWLARLDSGPEAAAQPPVVAVRSSDASIGGQTQGCAPSRAAGTVPRPTSEASSGPGRRYSLCPANGPPRCFSQRGGALRSRSGHATPHRLALPAGLGATRRSSGETGRDRASHRLGKATWQGPTPEPGTGPA